MVLYAKLCAVCAIQQHIVRRSPCIFIMSLDYSYKMSKYFMISCRGRQDKSNIYLVCCYQRLYEHILYCI